jgi:hypothetical protein
MWDKFPIRIRPLCSIYMRGSQLIERSIYPINKKQIYLTFIFYLNLFQPPCCPTLLSIRFVGVLGVDLLILRNSHYAPPQWVFLVKNDCQINIVDLVVGLTI